MQNSPNRFFSMAAVGLCSVLLLVLLILPSSSAAVGDGKSKEERRAEVQQRRYIYGSRPRCRPGGLNTIYSIEK
jgi:hypothetical protein